MSALNNITKSKYMHAKPQKTLARITKQLTFKYIHKVDNEFICQWQILHMIMPK